ncbi:MAG: hypothetical protein HY537_13930 [Deltaproteobacteria bacterium]|nr:hypothetical protein [Deltaproteobacteria bacterium]
MIFIVVSTGHFDPLIEQCCRLADRYEFLGQIGSGVCVPSFPHFRVGGPAELERHMRAAELVVSHAGTGMLSMLYNMRKKSVVIPKQKRYGESNDGQVELARKWGELGIGTFCLDVEELDSAITRCRQGIPSFPIFSPLGQTIRSALNFAPTTAAHRAA